MEEVYAIRKTMTNGLGKKTHVLMNDGSSEVLELKSYSTIKQFVDILNENSDSGWVYEIITIKN